MIGLDTNVVVRLLVSDDSKQEKIIRNLLKKNNTFYINFVVLAEVCWILDSVYELSKEDIIKFVENLLSIQQIQLEDSHLVRLGLEDYKISKADFADCLIGFLNQDVGCSVTVSFDKALQKNSNFEIL